MSFTPELIKERLRGPQFVPFRLVTTTNQDYDIYHPDMVFVGMRFVIVGTPSNDNPAFADSVSRIALMHITEMRDLPALATPAGVSA